MLTASCELQVWGTGSKLDHRSPLTFSPLVFDFLTKENTEALRAALRIQRNKNQ